MKKKKGGVNFSRKYKTNDFTTIKTVIFMAKIFP